MKKVITITLGGIVFSVEEDAFAALSSYLETVQKRYEGSEDFEEITHDIENAIAEKFVRAQKSETFAVTLADVERVTKEMGSMSEIDSESGEDTHTAPPETPTKDGAQKRLFRNTDDAILGGVASGIAAYFAIDPVIVRVLFFLSVFLNGLGVIVYILLWIIVPEAETTEEKYAMRGERVTLQGITDRVKKKIDEGSEVQSKPTYARHTGLYALLQKFFELLGAVIKYVLYIFRFVVGIILVVFGALALASVVAGSVLITTGTSLLTFDPLGQSLVTQLFAHSFDGLLALVGATLVVSIPILFLMIAGVSLLRARNTFTIATSVSLFILWVVSLAVVGAVSARYVPTLIEEKWQREEGGHVACTLDAKLCPDGTSVGRTGPDCTFAECPPPSVSEKADIITVQKPLKGSTVTSPLTIEGEARGDWFFEGSFPVTVTDWEGATLGDGYVRAKEGMEQETFVPFSGTILFEPPNDTPYRRGTVILKRANSAELPHEDTLLRIPVQF